MTDVAATVAASETSVDFDERLAALFQAVGQEKPLVALERCKEMLRIAPLDGRLHLVVGLLLRQVGQHGEAIVWLQRAHELKPESEEVLTMLASSFEQAGNRGDAAIALAKCLKLNPHNSEACFRLANLCHLLNDNESAARLYERATRLDPGNFRIWNNLGKSLRDLGRLEESLAAYDRALEADPDNPTTHCNRAITLMIGGRLLEGLREFEWRRRVLRLRQYPRTLWKGEKIPGKTLFLTAEQGFGDMIQFVRFARMARERAGRVILECRGPLLRLMQSSGLVDEVWETGQALPQFDYYSPLMSLPALFGITVETIPAPAGYLPVPEPAADARIQPGGFNVGLVWSGNPEHTSNAERSMPLEEMRPLLETPGVRFYFLQHNPAERDLAAWATMPQLLRPPKALESFQDTAALIGQLDLVITVDTSVAHLAGALGKPVWTFIHRYPDWRWMLERGDSPWYPVMRLFRQGLTETWKPVVERVAAELDGLCRQRGVKGEAQDRLCLRLPQTAGSEDGFDVERKRLSTFGDQPVRL
jgi:tetratricopeptide (TPR) repeat protein